MRTTVNLNEENLRRTADYAPRLNRDELIDAAFAAFRKQEARRRIAAGEMYQPDFELPPRRRAPAAGGGRVAQR